MIIAKEITNRILNDNNFSLGLAGVLKKKQNTLETLVKRNPSSSKLTEYMAIQFYLSQGYTKEEMFEEEEVTENAN